MFLNAFCLSYPSFFKFDFGHIPVGRSVIRKMYQEGRPCHWFTWNTTACAQGGGLTFRNNPSRYLNIPLKCDFLGRIPSLRVFCYLQNQPQFTSLSVGHPRRNLPPYVPFPGPNTPSWPPVKYTDLPIILWRDQHAILSPRSWPFIRTVSQKTNYFLFSFLLWGSMTKFQVRVAFWSIVVKECEWMNIVFRVEWIQYYLGECRNWGINLRI